MNLDQLMIGNDILSILKCEGVWYAVGNHRFYIVEWNDSTSNTLRSFDYKDIWFSGSSSHHASGCIADGQVLNIEHITICLSDRSIELSSHGHSNFDQFLDLLEQKMHDSIKF